MPTEPVVPEVATDYSVGEYIVSLRSYGRDVANRYNALRTWALSK